MNGVVNKRKNPGRLVEINVADKVPGLRRRDILLVLHGKCKNLISHGGKHLPKPEEIALRTTDHMMKFIDH